ncbi:MAG: DUF2066 domain-containing protein [Stellaceae bacterium]
MAPRLATATARGRARRLFICALLLLLAVLGAGPLLAQDSDDAYSATVKVDTTADSATAARDLARIDGQRRALAAVIGRLSGGSEPATMPKLDDKAITDMVESFEVANERMSAVRYIADFTFHFRPSKVRRIVRVVDTANTESASKSGTESTAKPASEAGAKGTADTGSRSVVVLPVYKDATSLTLWDDPNDWRTAWGRIPARSGPSPLVLPLGDAGDVATIDADKAVSGDSEPIAAVARRNGGSEVVVAQATARHQDSKLAGLEVSLKRYRAGRLVDTRANSYDINAEESEADFLGRVAEAVAGEIESRSKPNVPPRSDQQASLSATVPIGSLGEWLQIRGRLASVTTIRKIDLLALSRQEAKIELKYVGSPDQLKSSLAEVNLELGGGDPLWRIQQSSAAN